MKVFSTFLLWSFCVIFLHGQLTVRVTTLPRSTPSGDTVHMAGNFNNWNASDPNFQLQTNADGTKTVSLFPKNGKVEYKFTRGSWDKAEGGSNGSYLPNRSYQYDGSPSVVDVAIISWEDLDGDNEHTTATSNVHLLDTNFEIPQLERKRRIWIYLPPDYTKSNKRYPVIYMQDGQNLFDDATAFNDEWKVDETMDALFTHGDYGAIIIGVENGGWRRLDEYSPWYNMQLEAGGEGEAYVDFLVNTLKPYVDATYRTLPEREFTGILGSSMGGLIAHYAAIEHQETFGKVGVLSPSFWFSENVMRHTLNHKKQKDLKYYTIISKEEGTEMVKGVNAMVDAMKKIGFDNSEIKMTIHPDGGHSETYWGREFKSAYQWLFGNMKISDLEEAIATPIRIVPNPACSELRIENLSSSVQGAEILIVSTDGKTVKKFPYDGTECVNIRSVSEGMHIVSIVLQNRIIHSERIIVVRS